MGMHPHPLERGTAALPHFSAVSIVAKRSAISATAELLFLYKTIKSSYLFGEVTSNTWPKLIQFSAMKRRNDQFADTMDGKMWRPLRSYIVSQHLPWFFLSLWTLYVFVTRQYVISTFLLHVNHSCIHVETLNTVVCVKLSISLQNLRVIYSSITSAWVEDVGLNRLLSSSYQTTCRPGSR